MRLDSEANRRSRGRELTDTRPDTDNLRTELKQMDEHMATAERELNSLNYVLEFVDFARRQGYRVDIDSGTVFRPTEGSAMRVEKPVGAK
ncbi:hypothetical protein [Salinisphaera hydrothermalis]|uniref:hypothetical protein n=1 Tax=Salinisphaera hydrothermalis TaxID=563188 RepID=UPI0033423C63